MDLVVVESPKKAKKIGKILGAGYVVLPSFGHLCDLPEKQMGIDLTTFEPTLEVKDAPLRHIVDEALKARQVLLATDPDREGEGIAAFLLSELKQQGVTGNIQRVRFHEITPTVIRQAVANPSNVDQNLAEAQMARRLLDRLIGYGLSPVLWRQLGGPASAGRVQSCALEMLVEAHRAQRKDQARRNWCVVATLDNGRDARSATLATEAEARALLARITKEKLEVFWSGKERIQKPPVPLETASLLQLASYHGMNSSEAMEAAQELYEQGLTSYHRTDSLTLAWSALSSIRKFIEEANPIYLRDKARQIPNKSGAQAAHEAIRPTDIFFTPGIAGLKGKAATLYELIWSRTVASQGTDAVWKDTQLEYVLPDGLVALTVSGSELVRAGWHALSGGLFMPKNSPKLPRTGWAITGKDVQSSWYRPDHEMTEADLLRKLRDENVGRPSTYASIISSLFHKEYVRRNGNKIVPTLKGELICYFLEAIYPDLVSTQWTAGMEGQLDEIADGKTTRLAVVSACWTILEKVIEDSEEIYVGVWGTCVCTRDDGIMAGISKKGNVYCSCTNCNRLLDLGFDADDNKPILWAPHVVSGECPTCKTETLLERRSNYGEYIFCTSCGKVVYV